jgi:hypothetical protein
MDDSAPVTITGPTPLVEAFQQKDADIAWLLAEVEAWREHCGCCDCQRMRGGEVIGCECPRCKRYRAGGP